MSEWIRAALDLLLIGMVGFGVVQVMKLIKHLMGLRQGRLEMEHFVYEFNATVLRAEAGIKGLRQAARDSGDDLEKLVDKAVAVRDELQFIVESSDKVAERLSASASKAMRPDVKAQETKTAEKTEKTDIQTEEETANASTVTPMTARKAETLATPQPSSRAEKELMQALKKLS